MSDLFLLEADGAHLVPSPLAIGPWGERTVAGQVVTGALGRAAESAVDPQQWRCARFTADLHTHV
ncbi:MAG: hypothetical protein EON52_21720 [Actinomycetales bacterium]|nr:MAG: hypothetical protein EON52_21720 [Actinomycetales bacterium]